MGLIEDVVPESYRRKDGVILVSRSWWENGGPSSEEEFKRCDGVSDDEVACSLKESRSPSPAEFVLLSVRPYGRSPRKVLSLPDNRFLRSDTDAFPDVLRYVENKCYREAWRSFHFQRVHHSGFPEEKIPLHTLPHDILLFNVLKLLYPVRSLNLDGDPRFNDSSSSDEAENLHSRIIVTNQEFLLVTLFSRYNLYFLLNFTPSLLSPLKTLYILYQILRSLADVHSKGLSSGDVRLRDVYLDQTLSVVLCPDIMANVIDPEDLEENKKGTFDESFSGEEFTLEEALQAWKRGKLSNYDYLMVLNRLSGRTPQNPNYYPVLPWVRDFTSPTGGWRDLTKSKFRLNKGDQQLDLTYDSLLNESIPMEESLFPSKKRIRAPHHVSDLLSEITFYVYRARITSKSVLCKYVRQRWVPHEYPSSVQRLQEWTPDECIPDFYIDPTLFKSMHEDLPDLEFPPWCSTPEEFIEWHRDSLESRYVSERLHHWIDLTFGFKLTGSAAVRAKNVCLHLADEHTDLRDSGIIQLFNCPHPSKESVTNNKSTYFSPDPPSMDLFLSFNNNGNQWEPEDEIMKSEDSSTVSQKSISLPNDYDPLAALSELESNFSFLSKTYSKHNDTEMESSCAYLTDKFEFLHPLLKRIRVRDHQNLGVLILELFCYKKFSSLGPNPNLKSRHRIAKYILKNELHSVPLSVRSVVLNLLNGGQFNIEEEENYPVFNEKNGTPSTCAHQLLMPFITPELPFPSAFKVFVETSQDINLIEKHMDFHKDLSGVDELNEIKVKIVASNLIPLLDTLAKDELGIFLPTVRSLFTDPETTILSSWYLFDPFSKALGPFESMRNFLEPLINIFESKPHTSKHLKLYHRTFLLSLVRRFGTKSFLEYFTTYIIEAVGGYKDFSHDKSKKGLERGWTSFSKIEECSSEDGGSLDREDLAEGEVFAFDNVQTIEQRDEKSYGAISQESLESSGQTIHVPLNYDLDDVLNEDETEEAADSEDRDGNISQVAGESVIWLAHRLGPVLSARYLSRNLLRMLNLCFMGPECAERMSTNDRKSRLSNFKTRGDSNAENVLACLGALADLYGEQMILLQYIPYTVDLIENCKKRLNANMEGGIVGCLVLVHYIIPFLSDSIIMSEIQDTLLNRILFPTLQFLTSKSVCFVNGPELRRLLAFRLLDVVYLIGLRIGEEMCRAHMTLFCTAFFSSFEKVLDSNTPSTENKEDSIRKELNHVMTPEVAYTGFVGFYHLMGKVHLTSNIQNIEFITRLCSLVHSSIILKPINFAHLRISSSIANEDLESPASLGNKISAHGVEGDCRIDEFIRSMISRESPNTSRHLRGNWLAYWEHELGSPDAKFNLKQIKLQSFNGHSAGIKSLHVLDNENSFLSGSRDKTVKVWSLRNQNDEANLVAPQWTYTLHKKSVFSVIFLDSMGLAASCDSVIHLWDPFVGSSLQQFNGIQNVTSMIALPSPSTTLLAATVDSLLHLVDVRSKTVTDLRVSLGSAGLVKCMCIQSDGNTAAIGHSSGYISSLDLRTGKIRHAWKCHEGEILALSTLSSGSKFISTSLDQTVNLWNHTDAKLLCTLPGAQEPIHCICVASNGEVDEIITGSTANRVGVRQGISSDSPYVSSKIKSDIIKGNLNAMKLLSMNRLLLLGTDTGAVQLIC